MGRVADLVVVGEVGPGDDMDPQLGVPRVPGSDTLVIGTHIRDAVQGVTLLHLVDHLPHVHLDFPSILGESVETVCNECKRFHCEFESGKTKNVLQDRW